MKIDRFIVALTSADKFIELQPHPEGTLCFASDVAKLETKCAELESKCSELLNASKLVVECWDSPLWKWEGHTGTLIYRLRDAIAKAEGGEG